MTLMSSTSKLATSVDRLIGEANVTKAHLDAKVALAEAAIVATQAEQAATETTQDEAAAHAADAATHLATVKADVTYQGISAILAEKAVTAVDVFVYDTSLDSDGGAWRKRCQHTSWYNEQLNTVTRGARREFPAVAVIVSTNTTITIYDGDDPSLPMWMVLVGVFSGLPSLAGGYTFTSVAAAEGEIVSGSTLAMNRLRFVADECIVVDASIFNKTARANANIAGRGVSNIGATQLSTEGLVSRVANDVSMTVLPDAPVDPATGLPVPTISVATNGGLSIVRDDGTVINDYFSQFGRSVYRTVFAAQSVVYCPTSSPQNWFIADDIRNLENLFLYDEYLRREDATGDDYPRGPQATSNNTRHDYLGENTFATANYISTAPNSAGVFLYQRGEAVSANQNKGMIAKVQSSFNSGWMNGDIKGAFLSDTNDTDLVGNELVANGTFDTDTDWAKGTGWAISGGVASCDGTQAATTAISQTKVLSPGTYVIEFDITAQTSGSIYIYLGATIVQSVGAVGHYVYTFTATTNTTTLYINGSSTFVGSVDNISIRRADADRSRNNNGLIVNGTITRSPVVNGAELVGYSGFSDVNYLEASLKGYLPAGSASPLCLMGWFKTNSSGSVIAVGIDIPDVFSGGANGFGLTKGWSGHWAERATNVGYTSTPVTNNEWQFLVLVREPSGTKIYSNGVLTGSTGAIYPTSENPILRVGNALDGSGFFNGAIALLRISGTALTPDQIAKIYEDERKLFQPGAQCTLYGTSDAVTALAHDPKTNLLHVGTSAGRSTFDGLLRVANTETPVTTAISAVNGLIAEQ